MASVSQGSPRLLSRPVRVHWAGWETDTYRLQKAGWKLSAMQDIRGERLQLAMQHDMRASFQAITEEVRFPFEAFSDPYNHGALRAMDTAREFERIVLRVERCIAEPLTLVVHGEMPQFWAPIDAEPRITTKQIVRLEDLAHFAGPLIRTNEIIVPEESVPELLERILKLQQPDRLDRIREEVRGEHRQEQKFHAQIISMRDVA